MSSTRDRRRMLGATTMNVSESKAFIQEPATKFATFFKQRPMPRRL